MKHRFDISNKSFLVLDRSFRSLKKHRTKGQNPWGWIKPFYVGFPAGVPCKNSLWLRKQSGGVSVKSGKLRVPFAVLKPASTVTALYAAKKLIFTGFRKTRHAHAAYNVSRGSAANRGLSQLMQGRQLSGQEPPLPRAPILKRHSTPINQIRVG